VTQTKRSRVWIVPCLLLTCGTVLAQTFPKITPGQVSYTITPSEATGLVIDTLYLPDGFTLKVDPSVKSIDWIVNTIKIGVNATIDLSAPQSKPPTAPSGGSQNQAEYCVVGHDGVPGGNGAAGASGVSLTIHNVSSIQNEGSLWIRTDGGPGGDGGNGGPGQLGGGHKSFGVGLFHGGGCGSAGGGQGGRAGVAGVGGPTARVTIVLNGPGVTPITNGGVAPQCGPSQRPASVQGATGILVIWGAPGCGGQPGVGGAHGGHG
jgi:hypothetical protein